eukprot:4128935-Pyramimonas_sp.AAC.1
MPSPCSSRVLGNEISPKQLEWAAVHALLWHRQLRACKVTSGIRGMSIDHPMESGLVWAVGMMHGHSCFLVNCKALENGRREAPPTVQDADCASSLDIFK